MERLTKRSTNGTGIYNTPSGDPVEWENNRHRVLQKLADYEDLEEQGLLLKLPCKVGTKVYAFLPSDNHFTECQINKIEIKPTIYGNMCYFIEPTAHRGCLYRYFENDYGKTVFLTQEQAEKNLNESEV